MLSISPSLNLFDRHQLIRAGLFSVASAVAAVVISIFIVGVTLKLSIGIGVAVGISIGIITALCLLSCKENVRVFEFVKKAKEAKSKGDLESAAIRCWKAGLISILRSNQNKLYLYASKCLEEVAKKEENPLIAASLYRKATFYIEFDRARTNKLLSRVADCFEQVAVNIRVSKDFEEEQKEQVTDEVLAFKRVHDREDVEAFQAEECERAARTLISVELKDKAKFYELAAAAVDGVDKQRALTLYKKASYFYERAMKEVDDLYERAKLYVRSADCVKRSNPKLAEQFYENAADTYEKAAGEESSRYKASLYAQAALNADKSGDNVRAIGFYTRSSDLYEKNREFFLAASSAEKAGDFERAVKLYGRAFSSKHEEHHLSLMRSCLMHI